MRRQTLVGGVVVMAWAVPGLRSVATTADRTTSGVVVALTTPAAP